MNENKRLKQVRLLLKKTQQEFADDCGLKQGSYADQERGKVSVSGDVKIMLEKKYNVNILWIENGDGEMFREDSSNKYESMYNDIKEKYYILMEENNDLLRIIIEKDKEILRLTNQIHDKSPKVHEGADDGR